MLFIIAGHSFTVAINNKEIELTYISLSGNEIFYQCLTSFAPLACMVFTLITGYFMVNRTAGVSLERKTPEETKYDINKADKTEKKRHGLFSRLSRSGRTNSDRLYYQKLIPLIGVLLLYSVLGTIIVYANNATKSMFSGRYLFDTILPVFNEDSGAWYVIIYIVFYPFMPLLNKVLLGLRQKEYFRLLVMLLIVWSVIPTVIPYSWSFSHYDFFFVGYVIGAYIGIWGDLPKEHKTRYDVIAVAVCAIFIPASMIAIDLFGIHRRSNEIINTTAYYFRDYYSIPDVIMSIGLFQIFRKMKFHSRIIDRIASSVMGIYVLHVGVIQGWLWIGFWPVYKKIYENYFWLLSFAKILAVFLICLAVDQIRLLTVDKLLRYILRKHNEAHPLKD